MSGQQILSCHFCDRDDLTPQGHGEHERWCDENPNPGIAVAQQRELDILEEGGPDSGSTPNPDQGHDSAPDGLPSVTEMAGPDNSTGKATDGGEPQTCPLCDHSEVMSAAEAKASYRDEVGRPSPRAILAYEMTEWACMNPQCAAVWGGDADEPVTMAEVMDA